jgi:exosortase B
MSTTVHAEPSTAAPAQPASAGFLGPLKALSRAELAALLMLAVGYLAMFVPAYVRLAQTTWTTDEQGHGPLVLAVSFWLMYRQMDRLRALPTRPAHLAGGVLLFLGLLSYVAGHAQHIGLLSVGAQIPVLMGLVLLFKGWAGVRVLGFGLFFLFFMCPLPSDFVAYATGPLKSAVSAVAASILHALDYPVGRAGVMLYVGPYQLLVADACAGLNSMFTLEAMGLLYLNLMNYTALSRNVVLALAIIPISFCANVIRVCVLVLITYHFGDEAGQGFLHGFSGAVLFGAALFMIKVFDSTVGRTFGGGR